MPVARSSEAFAYVRFHSEVLYGKSSKGSLTFCTPPQSSMLAFMSTCAKALRVRYGAKDTATVLFTLPLVSFAMSVAL